ncbi:MAG: hypothetical protein EOS03_08470 [Mesorhizobium sp.]|uniref:hypothetical protein n=1 Tax=Mesorhizobium sp. TaxID=1871066 RepID=UPI000FE708FE|nr:hypothetical protein [Mesorhizobium sp.]RWN47547.1 MAG: hypothetical protein EOS03_08470 [Mesorhizobium sp.]
MRSLVVRGIDDDVLSATGRPGFRKTCRDAAGAKAMLRSLVGWVLVRGLHCVRDAAIAGAHNSHRRARRLLIEEQRSIVC